MVAICKALRIPVLAALMESYPFWIEELHFGYGTEYLNHPAGVLRSRRHAGEFARPRTKQSDGNALVELRSAPSVRKAPGQAHIPSQLANGVDTLNRDGRLSFRTDGRRACSPEGVDTMGSANALSRSRRNATQEARKSTEDARQRLATGAVVAHPDVAAHTVSDLTAVPAVNRAYDDRFRLIERTRSPQMVLRAPWN